MKKLAATFFYLYSWDAASKLEKLILQEKPDVAHLHIFQSRLTSAILPVLKRHRIPVVMTLHEYKMLCPTYLFLDRSNKLCEMCPKHGNFHVVRKRCVKGSLLQSLLSYFEVTLRDAFFPYERHVDRFLPVSDFVLNKHIQYKPALQGKINRLYNFIDLSEYQFKATNDGYYLFIGRLSLEKGVLFLVNAWKKFRHIPLLIVGDGPLRHQVEELILRLELPNVKLLGFKKKDELITIIQKAKYAVMPSLTYETFGLTLIESMACGTPPIAARIGGMNELVQDGINGLQFISGSETDFLDAIEKSIGISNEEYQRLANNGCKMVNEHFGTQKYGEALLSHYSEVISQSEKS